MGISQDAEEWISANVGPVERSSRMGGSGWAAFMRVAVKGSEREYFVKTSNRPSDAMFLGEALGLRAMYAANAVRIPEVLHCGDGMQGGSFIVMEYLPLGGRADPREFGRAMAQMHLAQPSAREAKEGKFGFALTNTIGGTTQPNRWDDDWVRFFREQRIGHQVKLAADARISKQWQVVLEATDNLEKLFVGIRSQIKPSVLHGDLWSGNIAAAEGRPCVPHPVLQPRSLDHGMARPALTGWGIITLPLLSSFFVRRCIFDPATYYGHHEAEWGMSWCASLGPAFWEGYREHLPEDEGFHERALLYELYHKLNHYNLFGGGYGSDSLNLMGQLARFGDDSPKEVAM